MNVDYTQARFILAILASVVAGSALFRHLIDGGQWVTTQSIVLGLYSVHSAIDDKIRDWRGASGSS